MGLCFLLCCMPTFLLAQKSMLFKGDIFDSQTKQPLENTCIHNISTGMATFSNKYGHFTLVVKGYDTLVITHVGYGMEHLIVTDSMINNINRNTIPLQMKSVMLKEFTYYALKPYPLFLEDVAKDAVNLEDPIVLTDVQKADATARLNPAMLTSHPITFLYEKFSRTAKLNRLYAYLSNHEDEVAQLNGKFSVEMVSQLTGFSGSELEDFLNYCSFSYYTLIKSSEFEIKQMILEKKRDYLKENGK